MKKNFNDPNQLKIPYPPTSSEVFKKELERIEDEKKEWERGKKNKSQEDSPTNEELVKIRREIQEDKEFDQKEIKELYFKPPFKSR